MRKTTATVTCYELDNDELKSILGDYLRSNDINVDTDSITIREDMLSLGDTDGIINKVEAHVEIESINIAVENIGSCYSLKTLTMDDLSIRKAIIKYFKNTDIDISDILFRMNKSDIEAKVTVLE